MCCILLAQRVWVNIKATLEIETNGITEVQITLLKNVAYHKWLLLSPKSIKITQYNVYLFQEEFQIGKSNISKM